jgi:hypothetical protein
MQGMKLLVLNWLKNLSKMEEEQIGGLQDWAALPHTPDLEGPLLFQEFEHKQVGRPRTHRALIIPSGRVLHFFDSVGDTAMYASG